LTGENNLQRLLNSMSPGLLEGEYVFCTLSHAQYGDYAEAGPIASFTEAEGLTLVLPRHAAEELGLSYEEIFRCITLGVHSSLQAVGLTAAVSGALARNGISANVIAAYFHDNIFVPSKLARRALDILLELGK